MPLPRPADLDPDETPDGEEEPPATYFREQAAMIRHQLDFAPPTDPTLLERLRRDLAYWERRVTAEDLGGHWEAGEGDRTLF
jgi:hypothetical protein